MLLLAILGATFDAQMISFVAGLLVWMVASFVAWGDNDEWADVELSVVTAQQLILDYFA